MLKISHILRQFFIFIVFTFSIYPFSNNIKNNTNLFSFKELNVANPDSLEEAENLYHLSLFEERRKFSFNKKAPMLLETKENLPVEIYSPNLMLMDGTLWRNETEIIYPRMLTMYGGILAVGAVGYFRLKDLQYNHPTTKFHTTDFKKDLQIYQQMDKIGHFTHAYYASSLLSKLYRWSGFSGESSIWYGTLTGWLWILQIEIADAFFEEWGFSWGDLIANTLGSGFSALQQFYPEALGGIQPKFSYTPSEALKQRKYGNGAKAWIDDYEGITWWLAVNVYHYMPEKVQNNYPDWLKPFGVAIGHSAKGIATNAHGGEREILIGLDFDLRKISFGDNSGLLRFFKNELNIIKLPMPAVKITPSGVWYGLYF